MKSLYESVNEARKEYRRGLTEKNKKDTKIIDIIIDVIKNVKDKSFSARIKRGYVGSMSWLPDNREDSYHVFCNGGIVNELYATLAKIKEIQLNDCRQSVTEVVDKNHTDISYMYFVKQGAGAYIWVASEVIDKMNK